MQILTRHRWGKGDERRREYVPARLDRGHPVVCAFFAKAHRDKVTYGQICDRSGVSFWTLKQWRQGRSPSLDNLVACLQVVGLELKTKKIRDYHS